MTNTNQLHPLYTSWGEAIDKHCPLNDYPRPQLRRENWHCLNGTWKYAICDGDTQIANWDGDILVPFSPESLLSGVGRQLFLGQTLWYNREVQLQKPAADNRLLLHFGAVDQHCRVWCNEQFLGEHSGGYWPFCFDITDKLNADTAVITLAVTDKTDAGNEAWGKQTLKRGGIWYTGQSGIWQTVWCEEVPTQYIEGLKITPLWRDGAVEITVIGGNGEGDVQIFAGDTLIATAKLENDFARLDLKNFRSWSPDDPFLYDVKISSGNDIVFSYFGMREFGMAAGSDGIMRLTLNGEPVFHNGLLDQGYWSDGMYTPPCDEAIEWEIIRVKDMGFNMLRKHIKIEPLRWYYHCDRLGMLVWQDFVSGGGPYKKWVVQAAPWLGMNFGDGPKDYSRLGRQSNEGRKTFLRDAKRTIELLYNTVALSTWVPFNEGWGQFDSASMYEYVKQADPTRLIDHASGYFDQGVGDFHSYHIYYKRFRPKHDKVPHRVLALTEFGGYSLPVDGHMASDRLFGYKVYKTQQEWHKALLGLYNRDVLPAIKKGMGALIYTQVSDVEDEINGLFTYDRRVIKVDMLKIRELNNTVYAAFTKAIRK